MVRLISFDVSDRLYQFGFTDALKSRVYCNLKCSPQEEWNRTPARCGLWLGLGGAAAGLYFLRYKDSSATCTCICQYSYSRNSASHRLSMLRNHTVHGIITRLFVNIHPTLPEKSCFAISTYDNLQRYSRWRCGLRVDKQRAFRGAVCM